MAEKTERKQHAGVRKYETAAELQKAVDKYFAHCEKTGEIVGEEGLAYHLGVTVGALGAWYDGDRCEDLQETVQLAYTRLQYLRSIDPRFMEKGMTSIYMFSKKQKRLGGWKDTVEAKQDIHCNVTFGKGMDESDFK